MPQERERGGRGSWGKHCWGQKRCPRDLAPSSPASPSCFQPVSRHARPQLNPDWLPSSLPLSDWLDPVITALPLYAFCTPSDKERLRKINRRGLILPDMKSNQGLVKAKDIWMVLKSSPSGFVFATWPGSVAINYFCSDFFTSDIDLWSF